LQGRKTKKRGLPRFFYVLVERRDLAIHSPAAANSPTATTIAITAIATLGRALVKFFPALALPILILATAAGLAHLGAGHNMGAAHVLIGRAGPVAGCECDFKFNDFIPLRVRALPLGNGKQRLQALAW
jgi:hypothetical protein